jgi:UDP-glucose 4-epimerase
MYTASQPERVVVLGGLGFLGSHICRGLVKHGHQVRIFDRADESCELIKDFEDVVEIVAGDVSQPQEVINALAGASVLINLVHTTVPGSSMKDPHYDVITNVGYTAKWLERLGDAPTLRKIIYFSSGGTVYGMPEETPIKEDHHTNPLNSYGITKLAVEKYTAMYANSFGINYSILRPSNVYGPGQRLHYGQGVIGIMIDRALRGESLQVWGAGTDRRDYLFIDDLVSAVLRLLAYCGPHKLFNVSSGVGHSVLDVISILQAEIKSAPGVVYTPARSFDLPVNVLDSSRLQKETGWRAIIGFEEGIRSTIQWMKQRLNR